MLVDPKALEWLTRLVGPQPAGSVALVGAGPGDPALITVRGAVRVAQADVILYDKLVNAALLALASPDCEKQLVGRRYGSDPDKQAGINESLIRHARAQRRVVRLKGGDPFIFGRGGEEALALAEAGVSFEFVAGVTAGVAVPASAGIPLTQRGLASTFAFVTAHNEPDEATDVDFDALARMDVVVVYMGLNTLGAWARALIDAGKAPDTPAAVIQAGTRPEQRTVLGTLADVAARVQDAGLRAPVITVVGGVASLREKLMWFESRVLFGRCVINTRSADQAPELSARLTNLGATVLEAPTIETKPPEDWSAVDRALGALDTYGWLILTSRNGVDAMIDRFRRLGLDARALGGTRIAAIGPGTASSLREHFLTPDLVPDEFVAESLAAALQKCDTLAGTRILLLRADIARKTLPDQLTEAGAQCDDLVVYRTVCPAELPPGAIAALNQRDIDWITFTSSSTVRNFLVLLGDVNRSLLDGVSLASIGPITSRTLRDAGLSPAVEAGEHTIDGLVEAMAQHESKNQPAADRAKGK